VKQSHWNDLVDLKSALEIQEHNACIRSITHGRPPKGFSAKIMEKSVIAALVRDRP
jgi:hypothetical protein